MSARLTHPALGLANQQPEKPHPEVSWGRSEQRPWSRDSEGPVKSSCNWALGEGSCSGNAPTQSVCLSVCLGVMGACLRLLARSGSRMFRDFE